MPERGSPHGVVVGVDGSDCSLAAVRWAAREAHFRHARLAIVHVVTEGGDEEADAVLAEAMAQGRDAAGGGGSEIETRRVHGRPVQALVDLSGTAQMIVVGRRGRTGRRPPGVGSVGAGQLHHAHCPVAIVHDDTDQQQPRPVLVGVDGSKPSLAAAAIAFDEASWRGADLLALHVCKDADAPASHDAQTSVLEQDAEDFLTASLADLRQQYPEVVVHRLVRFGKPARQLLAQAERAQLVVVGSHGRGGFAGKLLGSVSAAVADEARVPVIVARQP
ncbi:MULTISPECIES: universal stress protein [Mycolicibacterium]|uniref:universal stress protein n=1 Tax=Mycolicibacterium TaxID=1866885 RepID=UPI000564FC3C|nr:MULTISPECIES: universal stress protein [Mycolicibacterium]MDW5611353.1 universal stress protein [Mycolicibacterium sp. D5.8-2]QZY47506.1 universal stress protein [Mycolicibacterium austroafricanum]UJL31233.1 universal stress protein [Mycolicibacterium vanbaalenii]WND58075.1 universal stress protein [Mycolicibacterium vanbaalenii]